MQSAGCMIMQFDYVAWFMVMQFWLSGDVGVTLRVEIFEDIRFLLVHVCDITLHALIKNLFFQEKKNGSLKFSK